MYELSLYLGEVPDGKLNLSVGENPILKLTIYEANGEAWESGFFAQLIIHRSHSSDSDDVIIDEMLEVSPDMDNVYFFDLSDITFETGNYEAVLWVEGTYVPSYPVAISTLATPVTSTYSFEPIHIEVI